MPRYPIPTLCHHQPRADPRARRHGHCHGGDAARRLLGDGLASGLYESHGDGVRPRRPAVRLPAGRRAARDQERRAAADAVRHAHGRTSRRARPARRRLRSRTSRATSSSTSTTRRRRRPIHNRVSRFTANGDVAVRRQRSGPARSRQPQRRHQPQRRRHPLRSRRQALRRPSATTPTARMPSRSTTCSARCCASTPTATIPADNPFYRHRRPAPTGPSGRWPAQPIHVRLQARHRPGDVHQRRRRRTPGRKSTTAIAGANYGWPATEGRPPTRTTTSPLHAYDHDAGQRLRDHRRRLLQARDRRSSRPTTSNDYFFADFCAGWIRALDPHQHRRRIRHRHLPPGRPEGRAPTATSTTWPATRPVYRVELRRRGAGITAASGRPHRVAPGSRRPSRVAATGRRRSPISGSATASTSGRHWPPATRSPRLSSPTTARVPRRVVQQRRQRRPATRRC